MLRVGRDEASKNCCPQRPSLRALLSARLGARRDRARSGTPLRFVVVAAVAGLEGRAARAKLPEGHVVAAVIIFLG